MAIHSMLDVKENEMKCDFLSIIEVGIRFSLVVIFSLSAEMLSLSGMTSFSSFASFVVMYVWGLFIPSRFHAVNKKTQSYASKLNGELH